MTAKRHIHQGDQLACQYHDPDAALEEYRKALELDPSLAMAHWRIEQVHFFASPPRTDEAIAAFREAVRLDPKWSEACYWLGLGLAQKKQYEEGIKEHQQAIALSEEADERFLISLGRCLYEVGRYSQAIQFYQKGIRAARHEDAGYHAMLAKAQLANGNTERACAEWKRILTIAPSYPSHDWPVKEARTQLKRHCRD
jgi:superkiller protein 3